MYSSQLQICTFEQMNILQDLHCTRASHIRYISHITGRGQWSGTLGMIPECKVKDQGFLQYGEFDHVQSMALLISQVISNISTK